MEMRESSVAASFNHPTQPSSIPASSSSSTNNNNVAIDIANFVEKHKELLELLYPFRLIGRAVLHVVRWENYLLTSAILVCLCVLFYYPAFLVAFLVAMAITGMALGKYYSQTSGSKRGRERVPPISYLNEDSQELRKLHKENKASHKVLLEYKHIINNGHIYMTLVADALEYIHRVVMWKSFEVSICVTVLLCVLLALLCTIHLRVLFALLPLLVLGFNKYFLSRTVEIWRNVFRSIKFRLRRKTKDKGTLGSNGGVTTSGSGKVTAEVVHHPEKNEDPSMDEVPVSGAATVNDHDEFKGVGGASGRGTHRARAATLPAQVDGNKEALLREAQLLGKGTGVCFKCNTSFAKLLKRKHDCMYCGESYCGSCTVKVKRAELGATSPAAFEESVRVCLDCKRRMDEMKSSVSSS